MRILHTSDWHLGRIFHGIHLTHDQAYILEQVVDMIKEVKPDILLVAGDIFDRSVPPTEAVNLLDEIVSKIQMDHKVPIIMIAGNHDSPDRLGFGYRLLQDMGLIIAGKLDIDMKPLIIEDQHGKVAFHSIPYVEPAVIREKLEDSKIHSHDEAMHRLIQHISKGIDRNKRNVLVTHAFVAGGNESESERPLSVGGTGIVDPRCFNAFDYVALGHLHRPQVMGDGRIHYSGSLMKYSFSEANHQKQVSLIELGRKGELNLERIELKPKKDLRCVQGYLRDILNGPLNGESKDDYLMVSLNDEGAILDAMGKLRKVYPNVLHVERPQITSQGNLVRVHGDFKKMNELDLFSSFISQVTEKEITEDQKKVMRSTLDTYYQTMKGE